MLGLHSLKFYEFVEGDRLLNESLSIFMKYHGEMNYHSDVALAFKCKGYLEFDRCLPRYAIGWYTSSFEMYERYYGEDSWTQL